MALQSRSDWTWALSSQGARKGRPRMSPERKVFRAARGAGFKMHLSRAEDQARCRCKVPKTPIMGDRSGRRFA